ncbi:MAG: 5-(carboxyamino)imidazole ribonucleotide mutase [Candidatus Curtissbacteria bacterium]
MNKLVAIIMGSDSDLEVMSQAADTLDEFNITHLVTVVSAHRTPARLFDFAKSAKTKGFKVIIAGAGGAAHLPGMVASVTSLPVIGVPIKTKSIDGLDSLLSVAQMPPGVPVATVAVNGAKNAAILAAQIIALGDEGVAYKVEDYKKTLEKEVLEKAIDLENVGFKKYLEKKK